MAAGLPALTANVTNTVAPSASATQAARPRSATSLTRTTQRVRRMAAAGLFGAVGGVLLLAASSPETFQALVPWLLLIACALLAAQPFVTRRLAHRARGSRSGVRLRPICASVHFADKESSDHVAAKAAAGSAGQRSLLA